jgi:hypothetical protein
MREKLLRIVCNALEDGCVGHCNYPYCLQVKTVVDDLIANGVTIKDEEIDFDYEAEVE